MDIRTIIEESRSRGACDKVDAVTDMESLSQLLFSPQGREFCRKHDYPDIPTCIAVAEQARPYGIHVNERVEVSNRHVALIGGDSGVSELTFSGTAKAYTVILMHGAKAHITATDYAVVRIDNIGGHYTLDTDGTVKIFT